MTRDSEALARLREAYPGWRIWHVPGTGGTRGTWCAQPLPLINVGSPDELMRAIELADPGKDPKYAQRVDEALRASKGFDPEGDTWTKAGGSQGS